MVEGRRGPAGYVSRIAGLRVHMPRPKSRDEILRLGDCEYPACDRVS